jgi:epoxyqueuosine reductase
MTDDPQPVSDESIVERCCELGFAGAGIADAAPSAHVEAMRQWLAEGRHGSMGYLERNLELRLDPAALMPGARSLIMVADQYALRDDAPYTGADPDGGRIARYAQGRDYHAQMKRRLHALCDALRDEHEGHEFRAFVDTAPVLEREHAARAGLGWVGKHTLLIDPRRGSYFFLGGVLTTLPIRPPTQQRPVADHCGTCTRCIDACPTDAITPYSVDASRCIAYLTIEHRGPIDPEFHEPIGDWLFGCDICQEVCPHNSPRDDAVDVGRPNEAYEARARSFNLLEVLGWDADARGEAFKASALKRATLDMMRRNALICAGNALQRVDDPALRARIESVARDENEPPLVRETAREVLRSLAR